MQNLYVYILLHVYVIHEHTIIVSESCFASFYYNWIERCMGPATLMHVYVHNYYTHVHVRDTCMASWQLIGPGGRCINWSNPRPLLVAKCFDRSVESTALCGWTKGSISRQYRKPNKSIAARCTKASLKWRFLRELYLVHFTR